MGDFMERTELLPILLELFRQQGYAGVSIADVSKATGLGKSSLYHHFPEGKEQMAREVLQHVEVGVRESFVAPLKAVGDPHERLREMTKMVEDFYDGGRKGCILDGLTLGAASEPFRQMVARSVEAWVAAMASVAVEAGLSKKVARERAEDALIAIEGSLVLSRALGDQKAFKRVIKNLPERLLGDTNL